MDDYFWDSLIEKIRENNVVPVIGPRLYVTPEGVRFQAEVVKHLFEMAAEGPSKSLAPFHELHEAIPQLMKGKLSLQRLYDAVHAAIRKTVADLAMPVPLQQLAEITDFRLFVALSPDELFAQRVRQNRAL